MDPNQDLIEIKYLFEILYKVNKILYRLGRNRINKWNRLDAYKVMRQEGFFQALTFVKEKAKSKIDDENFLRASRSIENECEKICKMYQDYLSDQRYFQNIEEKLEIG